MVKPSFLRPLVIWINFGSFYKYYDNLKIRLYLDLMTRPPSSLGSASPRPSTSEIGARQRSRVRKVKYCLILMMRMLMIKIIKMMKESRVL